MDTKPLFSTQRFVFIKLTLLVLVALQNGVNAQAQKQSKKRPPLPEGVIVLPDIAFANPNGHTLMLDLYRPAQQGGDLPVVVFVHGGGWKNGSRQTARKHAWLAAEGFALVSISYRLTHQGQWPDQINDCYEAVRWVRRNAKKYHFDADNIGCWGTSAGGHLVALMGTRNYDSDEDVSSRVKAVCDWFGPSELLTMPPNNVGNGRTEKDIAASNGAKLLGATVRDVPDLARDASALDNVSADDAAFLIMHGDEDPGVPLEQSRRLHQRLRESGVSSELIILRGAKHGGAHFFTEQSKAAVIRFFQKQLCSP